MAKSKGSIHKLLSFFVWLTGILVSLAVGFGMADGVLYVRWIPLIITGIAGWVVIITTIIGLLLAIIKEIK